MKDNAPPPTTTTRPPILMQPTEVLDQRGRGETKGRGRARAHPWYPPPPVGMWERTDESLAVKNVRTHTTHRHTPLTCSQWSLRTPVDEYKLPATRLHGCPLPDHKGPTDGGQPHAIVMDGGRGGRLRASFLAFCAAPRPPPSCPPPQATASTGTNAAPCPAHTPLKLTCNLLVGLVTLPPPLLCFGVRKRWGGGRHVLLPAR